ncbi:type II toxin-antitoxin system RelE/ParE family toxin [Salininema proteolyticum]|uniref:Uncharacterized protein n=1 Tax=Salininema proteolyticum TaxID=1607685 RepID=A0ABV8U137_9ACTN
MKTDLSGEGWEDRANRAETGRKKTKRMDHLMTEAVRGLFEGIGRPPRIGAWPDERF